MTRPRPPASIAATGEGPATPPAAREDGVAVVDLAPSDSPVAAAAVAAAEEQVGGELLDAGERHRLTAAAADPAAWPTGWHPLVAHVGEVGVGYAAFRAPYAAGGTAVGDAAAFRAGDAAATPDRAAVLGALFDALADRARTAGAGRVVAWCRRVGEAEIATAAVAGFAVDRRLGVLGRGLPVEGPPPPDPDGVTIRASVRGDDDEAVVAILADAYGDGPDGGWDLAAFREHTQLDGYRPEDVLLAVDATDGRVLGLHWLKRRSATVGEVHNLAVHPDGQGRGLGPVLLRAGLDHLAAVGCDEVLLWVDRANARAVRLYERSGFTTRWDDVAFARDLGADAGVGSA